MPPAMASSYSPQRMSFAAYMIDFNPEPQTLLTVTAPALTGMPAPMPACRAGACPIAACRTLPMITCWICSACTPEFCSAHLMAIEPSFGAAREESVPRNEPIGVRAPPRITISFMKKLLCVACRPACRGRLPQTGLYHSRLRSTKSARQHQRVEPVDAGEAGELSVGAAERQAVLDGESGEMGIG